MTQNLGREGKEIKKNFRFTKDINYNGAFFQKTFPTFIIFF